VELLLVSGDTQGAIEDHAVGAPERESTCRRLLDEDMHGLLTNVDKKITVAGDVRSASTANVTHGLGVGRRYGLIIRYLDIGT
jgi:hypothetical protein